MGMLGRGVVITCGVFAGGGIGFYLKETYYVRRRRDKCFELEGELKALTDTRKAKEEQLKSIKAKHT